jgi:very-short-patch-repair endonuclease
MALATNIEARMQAHERLERELTELTFKNLRALLLQCESPIEQLLFIELAELWDATPVGPPQDRYIRGRISFPEVDRFTVAVRQQHPIRTRDRDYRADFLVIVEDYRFATHEFVRLATLVVEVDGHDHHERTKEQAAYDRKRDRAMLREGIPVMRFTGSEVFRDAHEAVLDIDEYLIEQVSKLMEP